MNKHGQKVSRLKLTTPADATRVQQKVANENGGIVPKGSVVGRLQRAAVKNFGKSGRKQPAN